MNLLDPRVAVVALAGSLAYWAYANTRETTGDRAGPSRWPTEQAILLLALAAAMLAAAAIATAPVLAFAAVVAVALFTAVLIRPVIGAYALLGLTPLIVGIDRGRLFPLLRPNEALLVLVAGALVFRRIWWWAANARHPRVHSGRIGLALAAVVLTSSVVPLLWLAARDLPLTLDDLTHAFTLAKFALLFLVIRTVVKTPAQVKTCAVISITVGAVVGIIGTLQSLGLFGVPGLLEAYYTPPFQDTSVLSAGRGSSTIANPISVGDVVAFNLFMVLALRFRGLISKPMALLAGSVLLVGVAGTGQVSAVLLLAVGVIALGRLTRTLPYMAPRTAFASVVAAVLLFPVIHQRIEGFGSDGEGSGFLPLSWEIRWNNLTEHFWPQLFSGVNWLLGVRPFPRLDAPEGIRDFIFIESGYTYLLWTGGIPLLIAFGWLLVEITRGTRSVARTRPDSVGAMATATYAATISIVVLMLLDPHHIMRGAADLFYPMVALSLTGSATRPHRSRTQPSAPRLEVVP